MIPGAGGKRAAARRCYQEEGNSERPMGTRFDTGIRVAVDGERGELVRG